MTTQQMEYFLEAAACLNFTTAAEHLYITQPALSKQIRNLENELDVQLFVRERNSVELTPLGRVVYDDLVQVYAKYKNMLNRITTIKDGGSGQLDFGVLQDQVLNEEILNALNRLLQDHPSLKLNMRLMDRDDLHRSLLNGSIDISVQLRHFGKHLPDFNYLEIESEPLYLAVSSAVDLSDLEIHGVDDYWKILKKLPIIVITEQDFGEPQNHHFEDIFDPALDASDLKHRYVSSIEEIPLAVVSGAGVTVANTTHSLRDDPHVIFLELPSAAPVSKGIFWNNHNQNPMIREFLRYLREEIAVYRALPASEKKALEPAKIRRFT